MGENRDYENLLLAAAVHDIGKFWQRAGGKQPSISMSGANKLLRIVVYSDWLQE